MTSFNRLNWLNRLNRPNLEYLFSGAAALFLTAFLFFYCDQFLKIVDIIDDQLVFFVAAPGRNYGDQKHILTITPKEKPPFVRG